MCTSYILYALLSAPPTIQCKSTLVILVMMSLIPNVHQHHILLFSLLLSLLLSLPQTLTISSVLLSHIFTIVSIILIAITNAVTFLTSSHHLLHRVTIIVALYHSGWLHHYSASPFYHLPSPLLSPPLPAAVTRSSLHLRQSCKSCLSNLK